MKPLISLGALIDTSFAHYKNHLPAILGLTLWLLVAAIPSALGIALSQDGLALNGMTWLSFGLHALGGILTVFASIHISVALILSLREQKQGKATDPRTFLQKAFALDRSYLWAMILKAIFVGLIPIIPFSISLALFALSMFSQNTFLINVTSIIAFITILIALGGAVKFSLQYAFVPYANVLNEHKGIKSLHASSALVKGRWWSTFIRVFIPKIAYTLAFVLVLALLLWGTGTLAIMFSQNSFFIAKLFALTNFFISTLINAFLIPLLLINDYYVYENLQETRNES